MSEANEKKQETLWLDKELSPKPKDSVLSQTKRQIGRRESPQRGWESLVLNEGTRDEIKMKGRYYLISEDRKTSLEIWNSPSETRGGEILDRVKGCRIFVLKDSEKSGDPLKRGWVSLFVIDNKDSSGLSIRSFSNGIQDFTLVRARYSDIKRKD